MIGVMVACVPEGLQVTVSSALTINVLKMVKQHVWSNGFQLCKLWKRHRHLHRQNRHNHQGRNDC